MTAELIPRSELLPLLGPVRKQGQDLLAFCPVHGDGAKHNGKGGQSLVLHASGVLKCYAGCSTVDVINALKARAGVRDTPRAQQRHGEPVAVYDYRDTTGRLLAVKGRFETATADDKPEKRFLWRLPEGSWAEGIKADFPLGVAELPLWGAELVATAPATQRVWIAEGEKATSALRARQELAVCGPWGASQIDFGLAFEILRGRSVLLWPDNDPPGREYMGRVKRHLLERGIVRSVAVVNAPVPPKGDAVEYFGGGGTVDQLLDGVLLTPTVDVLTATEYRVRVPTESGIPASFHFEDVARKGSRSVEAELTVTYGSSEPFIEGVNTLSQSGREALVRQLGNHFGKDVNWTTALNTAYSRLKSTFEEVQSTTAEAMPGDAQPSRVDFLLEPYVMRGGGTVLFGPPERGKSWTAMLMAVSVDAGVNMVWDVRRSATALYVNLERDRDSMARRLGRVNQSLGLPADRPILFINARGKTLVDVADAVRATIREKGVEFVVLDSVSRSGSGDLNDNQTANRIMDQLNGFGVTWLAIAHSPRGDDTHIFGSVLQDAAADVMVTMSSEQGLDGTLGVGLQVSKANDFRRPPAERLAYEMDDDYGLSAVRRAKDHEFVEIEIKEKKPIRQRVLEHLLANGSATASMIATATGSDYSHVANVLRAGSPFVFVRQEGREKFYGVEAREDVGRNSGGHNPATNMRSEDSGGQSPPIGGQHANMANMSSKEGWMDCSDCGRFQPIFKYGPGLEPLCAACG